MIEVILVTSMAFADWPAYRHLCSIKNEDSEWQANDKRMNGTCIIRYYINSYLLNARSTFWKMLDPM